jgi:prepilin-type processing-associated H-X9-DG protein
MKQFGLALLNYESTFKEFPEICTSFEGGIKYQHGATWMVTVFPYFEEGVAYDKFDQSKTFWIGGGGVYNNNLVAVDGYFPGVLTCPSSTLPVSYPQPVPGGLKAVVQLAETSYVGISGGAYTKIDEVNPALREWHPTTDYEPLENHGPISGGGMLVLKNNVRIGQCSDGTSKTMIVGEHSDFTNAPIEVDVYTLGQPVKEGPGPVDMRPSNRQSAFMGNSWIMEVDGPKSMRKSGSPNTARCYNMTVLSQYSVNDSDFHKIHQGFNGCNKPFRSTHPGGAMTLFTDGHVDFLTNETTLQILNDLANRDDGNTASL